MLSSITRIPVAVSAVLDDLRARLQHDRIAELPPVERYNIKTVKGHRYVYAVEAAPARRQRYLGAETPELLARIEAAQARKPDMRERAALVRSLRGAGLPTPPAPVGRALEALADAGVFRLRATLVGTHAFNCYPGLLGVYLPTALGATSDVDIAQDPAISVAVEDQIDLPLGEVLRTHVDSRTMDAPSLHGAQVHRWTAPGLELELLASNRGPAAPTLELPALGAHGVALRMLDFLIRGAIPAVVIHNAGVLVNVPDPARYAVHKLLISTRRRPDSDKARKDLAQAEALLTVLRADRPYDLAAAIEEAMARGPAWRAALATAVPRIRDMEDRTFTLENMGLAARQNPAGG